MEKLLVDRFTAFRFSAKQREEMEGFLGEGTATAEFLALAERQVGWYKGACYEAMALPAHAEAARKLRRVADAARDLVSALRDDACGFRGPEAYSDLPGVPPRSVGAIIAGLWADDIARPSDPWSWNENVEVLEGVIKSQGRLERFADLIDSFLADHPTRQGEGGGKRDLPGVCLFAGLIEAFRLCFPGEPIKSQSRFAPNAFKKAAQHIARAAGIHVKDVGDKIDLALEELARKKQREEPV